MEVVFPHVVGACRHALDYHETPTVAYTDALHIAARVYRDQWAEHRKRTGTFGITEQQRLKKYQFPSSVAKHLFERNLYVQGILASRDALVPAADVFIRDTIDRESRPSVTGSVFTFRTLLFQYIEFARALGLEGSEWRVRLQIAGKRVRTFTFPNRRSWAVFVLLRSLWCSLACAPEFEHIETYTP
jgi:hypothetical protein